MWLLDHLFGAPEEVDDDGSVDDGGCPDCHTSPEWDPSTESWYCLCGDFDY